MTAQINDPVVDESSIRARLIQISSAEYRDSEVDGTGNDWTALRADTVPDRIPEFVQDLFVLCRTTPGLFGPALLDGEVGAFDSGDSNDASVTVFLVVDDTVRIGGRRWVLHELFGSRLDLPAHEAVVACLVRIGEEAQQVVADFREAVG